MAINYLFGVTASLLQLFSLTLFLVFGENETLFNREDVLIDLSSLEFVHMMIFFGFAFLYAFIRRYS